MTHYRSDNDIIIGWLYEIAKNLADIKGYLKIMAGVSEAYECTPEEPSPSHEE